MTTNLAEYQRYREDVTSGRLTLPPYETVYFKNKEGKRIKGIKIYPGELFCRVDGCEAKFDCTTNLRKHVAKHPGYNVLPGKDGAMSIALKDETRAFFRSLYAKPADVPAEAPAETPAETPVEAPAETPAEVPAAVDSNPKNAGVKVPKGAKRGLEVVVEDNNNNNKEPTKTTRSASKRIRQHEKVAEVTNPSLASQGDEVNNNTSTTSETPEAGSPKATQAAEANDKRNENEETIIEQD